LHICIKMAEANIRVGRTHFTSIEIHYFQIELDGQLVMSSKYGSTMAEDLMSENLIPIGLVRHLSTHGICSNDYRIINGEIIEKSSRSVKQVIPHKKDYVEDLFQRINIEFARATLNN